MSNTFHSIQIIINVIISIKTSSGSSLIALHELGQHAETFRADVRRGFGEQITEKQAQERGLDFIPKSRVAKFFQQGSPAGLDLTFAKLDGIDLTGTNLSGAMLHGAGFEGSNLTRANLSGANLSYARFKSAKIDRTIFDRANLSSANFRKSLYIKYSSFIESNLSGSHLPFSEPIENSNFSGANAKRRLLE
jgi:uncharacterized protein YjbI with pentapeptide repeats